MSGDGESFRVVLLDHLCDLERYVRALFAVFVTMFVLLVASLALVSHNSATIVVIAIDLVSLGVGGVLALWVLLACRKDGS